MNTDIKQWIESKHKSFDLMIERYNSDDPNINPMIKRVCEEHLPVLKSLAHDYFREKQILTKIENHLKDAGII